MKYHIKNTKGQYLEMDFAGWNWQDSKQGACRFPDIESAEKYSEALTSVGQANTVEPI